MDEQKRPGDADQPTLPEQGGYEPPAYVRAAHESKPSWAITSARRMVYNILAAVVILALVGGCIGAVVAVANNNDTNSSANNDNSTPTTSLAQTGLTATPQPETSPSPTPTPKPTATPTPTYPHFGDGTYQVGKDIQPGTYRTRVGSPGCYYARLKGFGGTLDDIIANNSTDAPAIVTIAATDKGFTSENCGTWTKDLSQITQSKTSFGDGMYIVGTDIAPGTYKNTGAQGCYYARLSGFGNTLDDIIANNDTDAPAIVTIAATDKGFQSEGCGMWTKQ
jgi:hypothetical protein